MTTIVREKLGTWGIHRQNIKYDLQANTVHIIARTYFNTTLFFKIGGHIFHSSSVSHRVDGLCSSVLGGAIKKMSSV